ncbi:MAG: hypothetical protein EHM58_17185 [Ignavibacteriae bacterium]|nr:MAG: hypothetical protein EHM58_17185 [Ignavibacteriota bacterium]
MKIAVFINVLAGADVENNSLSNELKQVFSRYNVKPELINISGKKVEQEVDKVKKAGFDIIAASGGDGTVNSIASCLYGSDIPLAVIPTGTLNHFAKDLHIPLVLEEAVDNIFSGKITPIDTAAVNGK